jgi:pyridoxal phosphate enzyme (YggS family)
MKTLADVTIVCASKYFDANQMVKIFNKGFVHMGENRVDVLLQKKKELNDYPLVWHFIGHLQRNKVDLIIQEIDVLHSLDSLDLALKIQAHRSKPLDVFIQVNATGEPQKYGIDIEKVSSFYEELKKYDKIKVLGLMTMGKLDDLVVTEQAFEKTFKKTQELNLPSISMGMSDDYELALKHHATHLRLGRYFKSILEDENGTFS